MSATLIRAALAVVALLSVALAARADELAPPPPALAAEQDARSDSAAAEAPETLEGADAPPPKSVFGNLYRSVDQFTLVNTQPRLSYHRPSYVMPASYSPRFTQEQTEFIFQLSLKLQLFKQPLYFGYTQRSYWQIYNGAESRPFRETNYNPELLYRWKPAKLLCAACGVDLGVEHESNGQETLNSRSWNRASLAVYLETDKTLLHLKTWYRIPEDRKNKPDDPDGDDNPDIKRYLGYGELRVQRLISADRHLAALMVRRNAHSGKGAVELNYSVPFGDYLYWNLYYFNGYGESLIDYDRSVARFGAGVMLVR